MFAIVDERLTASLELREALYGVFVIAIFLFFKRGIVQTAADLFNRLFPRRPTQPAPRASGE
jgi:hypothetical protein